MDLEFDDDDSFGALPDDTLQELEYAAISSTQKTTQKPKTVSAGAQQPHIRTYGTTGLIRNNNANKNHWRPPQPRKQLPTRAQPQVQTAPPASAPAPPSSDYGLDEEDVIDLDEPSMVIQSTTSTALPSRSRSEAPVRPPAGRYNGKKALDPETEAAFAAADAELANFPRDQYHWTTAPQVQQPATTSVTSAAEVAALQARIDALLNEQTRLQQAEASARNAAQQKAGEIAIVRANHAKAEKEYERRIAVMQKMHSDESARAKAELEQGKKEREKLETDRRFLAHDFEEAKRERLNSGIGCTPRKKSGGQGVRGSVLGDGFDADEAMVVSPSRSKDREKEKERNAGSREHTPRVGNKRKRGAVQDSPLPVPALSFSAPREQVTREESEKTFVSEAEVHQRNRTAADEDAKYTFMQKLLHHVPCEGHARSIESLTTQSFPSNASRSLSALLLDGMSSPPTVEAASDLEPLPLKTSRILLNLWSQCLREAYYTPLYQILDLIRFSLARERAAAIATLIPQAVPLCIKTIELVANSTVRAALYPSFAGSDEYKKVREQVAQHIDVDEVLEFLKRLCDAAAWDAHGESSNGSCERFWQCVDVNFMLLMLNKAQHISQIMTTLQMLTTSTLSSSFGPICPHPQSTATGPDVTMPPDAAEIAQKQIKQENILIERLVSLLQELPVAPEDEPTYIEEEIQDLRLEILAVLRAIAFTDHGKGLLGRHRTAIGRLVRFLDLQMAKLYSVRPSLGLGDIASPTTSALRQGNALSHEPHEGRRPHDLISKTINLTVRLLYHLLLGASNHVAPSAPANNSNVTTTGIDPNINLQEKLLATRGGWHKFLVSFTRIAFSDQLVLEAGIEDAVVEAAHRVLDEVLSPEEGEAVCAAVETPRGTFRAVDQGVGGSAESGVQDGGEG